MRYLVDTHIALWTLLEPDRLSAEARAMLSDPANSAAVSYASIWEVAVKHAAHSDRMPIPSAIFAEKCRASGFALLSIEVEHISETEQLRLVIDGVEHRDPFDRILVAQARCERMKFMTHDGKLIASSDPCVIGV